MRTTFAVGRLTPRSAEIVLLDRKEERDGGPDPFPGPWKLRALVAQLRTRRARRDRGSRVH